MILGWLSILSAYGSACCVGATSAVPTRLGECERWLVGFGVGVEGASARYTPRFGISSPAPYEISFVQRFAAGVRVNSKFQLDLLASSRESWKWTNNLHEFGAGFGDLTVRAILEPVDERFVTGVRGPPVPILTIGLRIPTGRNSSQSKRPLLSDVTGLKGFSIPITLGFERTSGDLLWSTNIMADIPLLTEIMELGMLGSIGRTIRPHWTVLGHGSYRWTLGPGSTAATTLGFRSVHQIRGRHRAWWGISSDLPVPGLGKDRAIMTSAEFGMALVQ
jgi:hypothetical protein